MSLPICPNCHSTDVRTLAAAYASGTTQIRATSVYVGSRGNYGVAPTFGSTQTMQAKLSRPPRKKEWTAFGWFFLYGILGFVALIVCGINDLDVGSSAEVIGAALFVFGTLTAIWDHQRAQEYNETIYRDELERWERSFVCDRCMTVFEEQLQPKVSAWAIGARFPTATRSGRENQIEASMNDPRVLEAVLQGSLRDGNEPALLPTEHARSVDNTQIESMDFKELLTLAESGDVDAQVELGIRYEIGSGVVEDCAKAAQWFRLAAEAGNAKAQAKLGGLLSRGEGLIENPDEAFTWTLSAVRQGYTDAEFSLGGMYFVGSGVAQNYPEALKWFRRSAERGEGPGQLYVGEMYERGYGVPVDLVEAALWYGRAEREYESLARDRIARVTFKTGLAQWNGAGVEKNQMEALVKIQKAAEFNNGDAQYFLGSLLRETQRQKPERERNFAAAIKLLLAAAEQNHTDAQVQVGLMYFNGEGFQQDSAQAVNWWRRAVSADSSVAANLLGLAYHEGCGVPKDDAEAFRLFMKGAEQGNIKCYGAVASSYHEGIGTQKNDAEAVRWYRKSAEAGVAIHQFNLANMYYDGSGIEQDYVQAAAWYRKAAEAKIAKAEGTLAEMYEQGKGVAQDYCQAWMWYKLAADHGDTASHERLLALEASMSDLQIATAKSLLERQTVRTSTAAAS